MGMELAERLVNADIRDYMGICGLLSRSTELSANPPAIQVAIT